MKHPVRKVKPQYGGDGKVVEFESLLSAASESGVFTVEKHKDGFILTEACDNWHAIILTPDQLRLLGEELIALSKT